MRSILFIICILFSSASYTAAQDMENSKQKSDPQKTQQQPAAGKEQDKKMQPDAARDPTWPRTFIPSEKINADTVVSFPADI